MPKTSQILIETRTNRAGIEVRHESDVRGDWVRAYHLGTLAAERRVVTNVQPPGPRVSSEIVWSEGQTAAMRDALYAALDEGVRVLRDGRGLCECA